MKVVPSLACSPILLFLLWASCLSATSWFAGSDSYLRVDDNGDCIIPARIAVANELVQGRNTLWYSFGDCGADRYASNQACHADLLFFLAFPPWVAHALGLAIQRFVAGYFTYRLLKDHFAVSSLPAIASGLLYAMFFQSTINQSATGFNYCAGLGSPGIPMYLWALTALSQRPGILKFLGAMGLGMLLAGTSIFAIAMFFFPLWYLWIFIVRKEDRIRYGLLMIAFSCAWLAASIPTLIPSLYLAPSSHRADSGGSLLVAGNAYRTLVKLLENNAVPLIVALVGLFAAKGHTRRSLIIGITLLCPFLLFGTFEKSIIPMVDRLVGIGFVRGMNFKRAFEFIPFLTAYSMGLSIEALFNVVPTQGDGRSKKTLLGSAALGMCILWILVMSGRSVRLQVMAWSRGEAYSALYEIEPLKSLEKTIKNENLGRLATVVTLDEFDDNYRLFPGFMPAYGLESADGYLNLFPKRYLTYWTELIRGAASKNSKLANFSGNRLQLPFPYSPKEWLQIPKDSRPAFGELYDLNLLSAANVRYVVSSVPLADPHFDVVSETDELPEPRFSYSALLNPHRYMREYEWSRRIYIYRNKACLPRCYGVDKVETRGSAKEVLEALSSSSPQDLGTSVFLERPEANGMAGSEKIETRAEIVKYLPDEIVVDVERKADGCLVLVETFSTYWKAEIDGQPAEVFPANGAFMTIKIPRGTHQVKWRYRPPWAF